MRPQRAFPKNTQIPIEDRANGSHGHERMVRFKMEAFNGYRYR